MCGLFGYLSTDPREDQATLEARLSAAKCALHHRGPDGSGVELFRVPSVGDVPTTSLSLGHTRLSIIDLSSGGDQPMHSIDGRFTLVFNGEIYNYQELREELKGLGHKFETASDTEVLLSAWVEWGVDGLRRLTGMFAFAVHDREERSLCLVRDAFGIKPLFYHHDPQGLRFASEIPAMLCLIEDRPALNLQSVYNYLVCGSYDSLASTFHKGINHLLPGHFLRVDLDTLQVNEAQRWWWPSIEERTDLSFDDAAAQLREMFLNNVRLHLRSDVPVGAALSGGVDSSAIVCAMRHLEPDMPIHTFSYLARGSSANEEKWVDIVNAHVGAIAHKVIVEPKDLSNDLVDVIHTQGEPFSSTSIYAQYRVFKAAREAGIIVMLDGQGADELLAGYEGYPASYLRSLLEKGKFFEVITFLKFWSQWPGRGPKRALLKLGSEITPGPLKKLARRAIGHNLTPNWLNVKIIKEQGVVMDFPSQHPMSEGARGRRLSERLRSTLSGNGLASLLRHGDRNSMRWSIESRVPFLTTDIAEFLLQLPEHYLLSPEGETKHIFRAAMRGLVPDAILDRKDKIGFETPEGEWLSEDNVKIANWLDKEKNVNFLDKSKCISEIEKIVKRKKNIDYTAWRLLNFTRWNKILD